MKLSDQQRERLWIILKGANCTDEWLMHYGEYLCDNIASLIERPIVVNHGPVPNSVTHHYRPPSDFGIGMATGLIIGGMFDG